MGNRRTWKGLLGVKGSRKIKNTPWDGWKNLREADNPAKSSIMRSLLKPICQDYEQPK